ncbi:MAG: hypothetical protein ACKOE2_07270, partial [Actinomycetales bacterium]
AGATGAELFLAALGDEAGPFATTTSEASDETEIAAAEEAIARSSAVVVGADGGLVHYRNTWPEDPLLNRWVRLVRP